MEVIDGLTRPRVRVEDDPVSVECDTALSCETRGQQDALAYHLAILGSELKRRGDVLAGHDQDMHRRLGMGVLEGHKALVLVHLRGRNFPLDNLAEETAHDLRAYTKSGRFARANAMSISLGCSVAPQAKARLPLLIKPLTEPVPVRLVHLGESHAVARHPVGAMPTDPRYHTGGYNGMRGVRMIEAQRDADPASDWKWGGGVNEDAPLAQVTDEPLVGSAKGIATGNVGSQIDAVDTPAVAVAVEFHHSCDPGSHHPLTPNAHLAS